MGLLKLALPFYILFIDELFLLVVSNKLYPSDFIVSRVRSLIQRIDYIIHICSLCFSATTAEKTYYLTNALGVLTTALNMNNVCTSKHQHVESEIYLALGRIQHQLYLMGKFDYHEAVKTLTLAIKSAHSYDHDLGYEFYSCGLSIEIITLQYIHCTVSFQWVFVLIDRFLCTKYW